MRPDATLRGNPFEHLEAADDPYPADRPLPGPVARAAGSTDRTRTL